MCAAGDSHVSNFQMGTKVNRPPWVGSFLRHGTGRQVVISVISQGGLMLETVVGSIDAFLLGRSV